MNTSLAEQPAYPLTILEGMINNEGMTLRQYYAGLAMQGLLANPEWMKVYRGEKFLMLDETVAKISLGYADALLTALSQEPLNNKQ